MAGHCLKKCLMLMFVDINDCVDNPCSNGGVCVDRLNGFECDCPVGISGPLCEGKSLPILWGIRTLFWHHT